MSPIIAASLIALAGCTGAKQPSITLTGATLGAATDDAATLLLALRLHNPNNEPLELLEFDYQVTVDGERAYQGKRAAQMTLARLSSRDVEIPAVFTGPAADRSLNDARVQVRGTLRYVVPGAIAQTLFDTGVSRPRASFQGEARLTTAAPATTSPE